MRFNIVLGNHPAGVLNTTRDHTLIIAGGLRDAGHEAVVGLGTAHRDQVNLFYDCLDERTAGTWRQLKAGGYRFGIVCTEIMPGDGTVNGRTDEGARSWLAGLSEVGRLADFVWVMHGPSLEPIRALTGNPRCFYLPLGFTPAAREIRHVEPDIDFLFFGKLTRYRAAFLQELANRGHRVEHVYNVPGFIRNALIGRARINLALRQEENWDQPSAGRLSYLVTNRCAVVCDQTANGLPYESYTVRAPAADFVAACEEALRGRAWLSQAEAFAEALRARAGARAGLCRAGGADLCRRRRPGGGLSDRAFNGRRSSGRRFPFGERPWLTKAPWPIPAGTSGRSSPP